MERKAEDLVAIIARTRRMPDGLFLVLSTDGLREYRVTPEDCTCEARKHYPGPCKHMEAVSLLCPPAEKPEPFVEPVRRIIIKCNGIWCDTYYTWTKAGLDRAERDAALMRKHYPENHYEIEGWQLGITRYAKLPMPSREELP